MQPDRFGVNADFMVRLKRTRLTHVRAHRDIHTHIKKTETHAHRHTHTPAALLVHPVATLELDAGFPHFQEQTSLHIAPIRRAERERVLA